MHPFTANAGAGEEGRAVITRAKGVTLTDSEGNEILDGMAGLWCVNIGYGRARNWPRSPPGRCGAALLQHLLPDQPRAGHRAGRAAGGTGAGRSEPCVLRRLGVGGERHQHPHGAPLLGDEGQADKKSSSAARTPITARPWAAAAWAAWRDARAGRHADPRHRAYRPAELVPGRRRHDPEEFGLERARQLEAKIEELGEDRVAAFIAEPIQGAGGVIVPPDSYWPEIQRICDKYDILLIADEVITGFGRTGNWFGSQT
jgi:putrescine---pyruvate transaminase